MDRVSLAAFGRTATEEGTDVDKVRLGDRKIFTLCHSINTVV